MERIEACSDPRIATLTAERDAARAELADLRATFYGAAEVLAPDLAASERKGCNWWYAAWKVGNRIRAELAVEAERAKARARELEAELAKERERTAGLFGAEARP